MVCSVSGGGERVSSAERVDCMTRGRRSDPRNLIKLKGHSPLLRTTGRRVSEQGEGTT